MAERLTLEEVQARIAVQTASAHTEAAERAQRNYHYVRPFSVAAEGLIEFLQNPDGRFMLGIEPIDLMTRGFGKGELAYVTGRAHSGKTQVLLNAIASNVNDGKRIIMFTPDEVNELVLAKLVALRRGVNSEALEESIRGGSREHIEMLRKVAAVDFRNFICLDQSLSLEQMTVAMHEAEDYWGAPADAVIIDFLELLPSNQEGGDGVVAKSQGLKRWTKEMDVPVICLHQASRSSGNRGTSAGMNAMRYGGECLAHDVLLDMADGTRRRADEIQVGDQVMAWGPHDGPRPQFVTAAWDNGIHPIYEITTSRGRSVRVTGNHPFLTKRGWVRADELATDDDVRIALGHIVGDGGTADHGYFLGAMLGDGHIGATSRKRTSFTNDDDGVLNRLNGALGVLFDARLQPTDDPISFTVRGNGWHENLAWKYLEDLGLAGTHSGTKFIPDAAWLWSPEAQFALIAGLLDTDGTIDTSGRVVVTYTTSRRLASDLQAMLARLGFQSSVTSKAERTGSTSYRVTLNGGMDEQYRFGYLVPLAGRKRHRIAGQPDKRSRPNRNGQRNWDMVTSITVTDPEPTLAITVENDHTFITNGIVTHNTEAIFVLEVFRKREDDSLDEWEKQTHQDTITIAVHKNKRPPCKTGEHDFYLDPKTGLIRRLNPGDTVQFGMPMTTEQALDKRRG